ILKFLFGAIDELTHRRALFRRQPSELLELFGDLALLAEETHTHGIERDERSRCRARFFGLPDQLVQMSLHVSILVTNKKGKGVLAFPLLFGSPRPRAAASKQCYRVLGRKTRLGLCRQGAERHLVEHGEVRQDLTVDLDRRLLEAVHETAMGRAGGARRGGGARGPRAAGGARARAASAGGRLT